MIDNRAAIKDFNLPYKVSDALKTLPDISKIYRTFPKKSAEHLVALNFYLSHSYSPHNLSFSSIHPHPGLS